jgi:hypothetical protein
MPALTRRRYPERQECWHIFHGGDPMFPHIAMMQALHRHEPKAVPAPRRKRAKVYKIVR